MENLHKFRPIIVEEESGGGLQWELYDDEIVEFNSDDDFVATGFYPSQPNILYTVEVIECDDNDSADIVGDYGEFYTSLNATNTSFTDVINGYTQVDIYPSGASESFYWKIRVRTYVLNDNGTQCTHTHLKSLPRIEG